jgi:ribonuclease HII
MQSYIEVGVDEAGRGCICSDLCVAAVALDPARPIAGLADSKTLSAQRRESLAAQIKAQASAWSVVHISPGEVDELNILQATLVGMKRAVESLSVKPDKVLVDGNQAPALRVPVETIVKGDSKVASISAASILAKVERDKMMMALHAAHPEYAFDRHKGYPTKLHLDRLRKYGVLPFYRKTYRPVRKILNGE